jgi:pyrroline-5-carboxylate reductase
MQVSDLRFGIIGGGMMAHSIVRGLLAARLLEPKLIAVSDPSSERRSLLEKSCGVVTSKDNLEIVRQSNVVLLAVKPQSMPGLLAQIEPVANSDILFLSIAAGITTEVLHAGLGRKGRIVRIMPNTAAQVQASATAICQGPDSTDDDLSTARFLFDALGTTVVVDEAHMDAVTGLSGSGPAYVYLVIEALADAGVRNGLTRATAVQLAAQTCAGASKMVLETGEHPGVLKDQVTSPGGTTINGLYRLEKRGVRAAIIDAVTAAVERSKELGS